MRGVTSSIQACGVLSEIRPQPARRKARDATLESSTRPARKRPNTKRTGELAEAAFLFKAQLLGFRLAKPWGDSERYDFIIDNSQRCLRVQVKCTESINARAYQVQSTYRNKKKKGKYTARDVDALAAYVIPLNLWHVIPVRALPASASLRFYPHGGVRRPRFEQFREAWHHLLPTPV